MTAPPTSSGQRSLLTGRRILVVEDEYFLADDIGKALRALGAEIAAPVGHIEDAVTLLNDGGMFDGAYPLWYALAPIRLGSGALAVALARRTNTHNAGHER